MVTRALANYTIALIPGDGVGPEIMRLAEEVLERVGSISIVRLQAGLAYYRATGKPYPEDFEDKVLDAEAVIKGPIATPSRGGYSSITLMLRRLLGI